MNRGITRTQFNHLCAGRCDETPVRSATTGRKLDSDAFTLNGTFAGVYQRALSREKRFSVESPINLIAYLVLVEYGSRTGFKFFRWFQLKSEIEHDFQFTRYHVGGRRFLR